MRLSVPYLDNILLVCSLIMDLDLESFLIPCPFYQAIDVIIERGVTRISAHHVAEWSFNNQESIQINIQSRISYHLQHISAKIPVSGNLT